MGIPLSITDNADKPSNFVQLYLQNSKDASKSEREHHV